MRFTAILTYLSVPPVHIIIVSHIRFDAYNVFTVPMRGSEVANPKPEIHLTKTPSEVTWACDVATFEREGDHTLFGILYMLLRLVEFFRRSCKQPEARNTLRSRLVVWTTAVLTNLSVLLFHIAFFGVRLHALFTSHYR